MDWARRDKPIPVAISDKRRGKDVPKPPPVPAHRAAYWTIRVQCITCLTRQFQRSDARMPEIVKFPTARFRIQRQQK